MKIIQQSFTIESDIVSSDILKHIEKAGRTAYKSEHKITEDSAEKFVAMLIRLGHESVLEHYSITVRLITDRAIANELVRHRIASYTQESTRYVDYNRAGELIFIDQKITNEAALVAWRAGLTIAEQTYLTMRKQGARPEVARSILPLCTKTEIVITANLREWRHIFKLRCAPAAHYLIRELMTNVAYEFRSRLPIVFDDIELDTSLVWKLVGSHVYGLQNKDVTLDT